MQDQNSRLIALFERVLPLSVAQGHWLSDQKVNELIKIIEGKDKDEDYRMEIAINSVADLLENLGVIHRTPEETYPITCWKPHKGNKYASLVQMIQTIDENGWMHHIQEQEPPLEKGWELIQDVDEHASPGAKLWFPFKNEGDLLSFDHLNQNVKKADVTLLGARHACSMLLKNNLISQNGGVSIPRSWRKYFLAFVGTAWKTSTGYIRIYGLSHLSGGMWYLKPIWMDTIGASRIRIVVAA